MEHIKNTLRKLRYCRKKAIRAINNASYNVHTNNHFFDMRILRLEELYEMHISKKFYRVAHRLISKPLQQRFSSVKRQDYNTRNTVKAYSTERKLIHWDQYCGTMSLIP